MSALLTANQVGGHLSPHVSAYTDMPIHSQFEDVFPQVKVDDDHPNHATLQSFVVAIYVRSSV